MCDAPCSGDGTIRKSPRTWSSWRRRRGASLLENGEVSGCVILRWFCVVRTHPRIGTQGVVSQMCETASFFVFERRYRRSSFGVSITSSFSSRVWRERRPCAFPRCRDALALHETQLKLAWRGAELRRAAPRLQRSLFWDTLFPNWAVGSLLVTSTLAQTMPVRCGFPEKTINRDQIGHN